MEMLGWFSDKITYAGEAHLGLEYVAAYGRKAPTD